MESLLNLIKPLHIAVASHTAKVLIPCQKTKYQPSTDLLRNCRKSPKMANLAISHVMKSIAYKHQIPSFRVFRQSLRIPEKYQKYRY